MNNNNDNNSKTIIIRMKAILRYFISKITIIKSDVIFNAIAMLILLCD